MKYAEGVTLMSQLIEDMREEVARDEAKAQEIWDQAAYRTAHLDSLEESLKALVAPFGAGDVWAVMPEKPCAPRAGSPESGCAVPTKEAV